MGDSFLVFSAATYVVMILAEVWIAHRRGRSVYSFADTFTNLACGIGSELTGLFLTAFKIGVYFKIYALGHFLQLDPSKAFTWVLGFLVVDFCYYIFHRVSHTVPFLWANHVVHHQSEQYNFSVALRQSWFSGIFSWVFYAPAALLGIPPEVYALCYSLNLFYQFFLHTRLIRSLGPLEWVLNTPSHHRVHHGSNPPYIDKNFGGALIVWDRLLRSFIPEGVPVRFGITKPFRRYNAFWANLAPWFELFRVKTTGVLRPHAYPKHVFPVLFLLNVVSSIALLFTSGDLPRGFVWFSAVALLLGMSFWEQFLPVYSPE